MDKVGQQFFCANLPGMTFMDQAMWMERKTSRAGAGERGERKRFQFVWCALFLPLCNIDSLRLLLGYVSLLPGGFVIRWRGVAGGHGGGQ